MATDPWRQWAAFAALFNPTADRSGLGAFPRSPPAFAPFWDAERFAAAVRTFQQSAAQGSQTAAATFGDFLRDQFSGALNGMWGEPATGRPPPSGQEAAALGPAREQQERLQRAAEAWQRLDEAQRRLQRLWSDALSEAARAFVSRLGTPGLAPTPEALHGLYDAWIDCAEEAYARAAHGEPFCAALADAVHAASDWRRESAASIEAFAKWLDLPTRSEINSLSLRVRALEEQRRASNRKRKPAARPAAKKRTTKGGKR